MSRRLSLLVVSIAALTVASTSVVAVSPGAASARDPLGLGGRAPSTVALKVSVTTGGLLSTSGEVWLDAATNSFSAKLEVPLVTSSTEFDVRAVNKEIYLTSPNLANASGPVWYTLGATWPALANYAHVLARPNAAILTLLANARITRHGGSTTYESTRSGVSLGRVGASSRTPSSAGALDVRLTTGPQGEFTGLRASLTSGAATTVVSISVVSYNRPLSISAPPRSRATSPAGPLLRQLLTSGALGSFVLPTSWVRFLSRAKLS